MASSSAGRLGASGSIGQTGGGYGGKGSPVPYRTPPLGYDPPVKCDCDEKACRWISWSALHPGMRYYRCARTRGKDCGFFEWLDEAPSEWFKQRLVDLRDQVWKLKEKLKQVGADDGCDIEVVDEDAQMKQYLQEEVLKKDIKLEAKGKEVLALMKELQSKDKEIEVMKAICKKQQNGCQATLLNVLMFVLGFFVALVFKRKLG